MRKYDEFELTMDHIKLLQHAYVTWYDGEFGAPGINSKKPYGNSNVYSDMLEILDIRLVPSNDEDEELFYGYPTYITTKLDKLHGELLTALQIVLRTRSFVPGLYRTEYPTENWKLVK